MLEKFDAEHIEVRLKPRTQEDYRRTIKIHIKPRGHMLVHQVARQDMMRLHHAMREKKYAANRTIALHRKIALYKFRATPAGGGSTQYD